MILVTFLVFCARLAGLSISETQDPMRFLQTTVNRVYIGCSRKQTNKKTKFCEKQQIAYKRGQIKVIVPQGTTL